MNTRTATTTATRIAALAVGVLSLTAATANAAQDAGPMVQAAPTSAQAAESSTSCPLTRVGARATDGSELRFAWDRAFAPTLGIWLDYGGWPPGESRHQVALEPTTSADDALASAIEAGRARILPPGTPLRWNVRLGLTTASRDP